MERALAHDLRGVLAAASSNIEFACAHELPPELSEALVESLHELRVAADAIALLGSTGERTLEVDLRAALLIHRGADALAVDATGEPFLVRGTAAQVGELARRVCTISLRGRTSTESEKCTVGPVDPDGARALLATDALSAVGVRGHLESSTLVLERGD